MLRRLKFSQSSNSVKHYGRLESSTEIRRFLIDRCARFGVSLSVERLRTEMISRS
jgi:hypothetical protein